MATAPTAPTADRIAALLGATPDARHRWLSVATAERPALPAWLVGTLATAEGQAAPLHLPLAVLHEPGQRPAEALVILRLAAFVEWFADGGQSVICRRPVPGRGR